MKRELFNKAVEFVFTSLGMFHKHTIKEQFESYCFLMEDGSKLINQLKKLREEGLAGTDLRRGMSSVECIHSKYFQITYDNVKDKISVSVFETGWKWAHKKSRYYPYSKNTPQICYSKNLYVFHFRNNKPRLLQTSHLAHYDKTTKNLMKLFMGIDFDPEVRTLAKYAIGAQDDWEIIFNKTGVKVPKALRIFESDKVMKLIEVLANPNELNSLCQWLSRKPITGIDDFKNNPGEYGLRRWDIEDLFHKTIAGMLSNGKTLDDRIPEWLVRDYISDCHVLKRKMSLKMTSKKRMVDEHRKMSAERILLGIRAIKVHEDYKNVLDYLEIPAELIKNKRRLAEESEIQSHCVATYADKINRGECCIVSCILEDKRWTIEVGKREINEGTGVMFNVLQMRGYRNESPPNHLQQLIQDKLEKAYHQPKLVF